MDKRLSQAQEPAFPLKSHLESMSDRTRALLEYYFDNDCRAYFAHVTKVEKPDIVIVDYDHPGSRAAVAAGKWNTERPLLLLSFSETSVPGAILVRKPFNRQQLQQAALRLMEDPPSVSTEQTHADDADTAPVNRADEPLAEVSRADPPLPSEVPTESRQPVPELREANEGTGTTRDASSTAADTGARLARVETKVALLCGAPRTIAELEATHDMAHRFSSARHLSGHVEQALQRCGHEGIIAVQLTLPAMEIYVLHWLQKVFTTASLKSARNVDQAFREFDADEIKMTVYRSTTVNELVKRVNGTGKFSFSTEAFLWLSALFSARGRLPVDIQLDQTWRMIQWPNLTRLEPVPQCVETATAWSREPASIRQIITRTGHQPRHVVSFFNGARALKLMVPELQDLQETESTDTALPETAALATDETTPANNRTDKERPAQG